MSVSLICACKNRIKPLTVSLASWLNYDEIEEIIIVDWDSDKSISYLCKLDSRIKIIRVNHEKYFNQPQPLNLALQLCTKEKILKVDTDYILSPYFNFFNNYEADEKTFICGDKDNISEDANIQFYKYLRGLLFVKKEFLDEIGGYNENICEYYAGEDLEIETRLKLYGLNQKNITLDYTLMHIPHEDIDRVKNFKAYTYDSINDSIRSSMADHLTDDQLYYNLNYSIAQAHINQNVISYCQNIDHYYVKPKINWKITQVDDQYYFSEKI